MQRASNNNTYNIGNREIFFFFLNFTILYWFCQMNPPQVYMCSPSWTLLPPPSPYHPSGSSQCTSPKHPVSCVEPGLATHFIHDILHVSMPFSQIIPSSPAPTESKTLFYTSVSLFLSRIQGYCYHLSKFYIDNIVTQFHGKVSFLSLIVEIIFIHIGSQTVQF